MTSARIEARVHPRSGRKAVEVISGTSIKVYVTEAPEDGKANEAVITLIAGRLHVAKSNIVIIRGHNNRNKLIQIEGLTSGEVSARLSV